MSKTNQIVPVEKRYLLLANAVVWGLPGIKILITGVEAYLKLWPSDNFYWLILGSVLVLALFTWMFSRIVKKYSSRILSFPEERKSLFAFLSVKGYILVLFMMCLGISLKFIPGIPPDFYACFYTGLGIALCIAAALFFAYWMDNAPEGRRRL